MVPLSLRRSPSPHPDSHKPSSELCTLAPWEELAVFRKEAQLKFEELFEIVQRLERRDSETTFRSACQQMEAKIERFARQVRGLHSRSEVFEGHMTSQAKELDHCRESQDAIREKIQQSSQELGNHFSASLSTLRAEIDDVVERRHGAALEACRRADRTMADELLRKMGELNEKLGANMLSLEEEVAEDSKLLHAEIKSHHAKWQESHSGIEAQLEQHSARHETRLAKAQEAAQTSAREMVTASERAQAEHAGRLGDLELRLAKLQDSSARMEARIVAEEQASAQKVEQIQELIDEGSAQTAASLVRVRSESETAARDIVRAARDEFRDDVRSTREDLAKEAKSIRDEFRSGLASSREQVAAVQKDAFGSIGELKDELHNMCRDVVGMVDNVRVQVANTQVEARTNDEANRKQMHDELDARVNEIREQITAAREEARESGRDSSERISSLTESVNSVQPRLCEFSNALARLQSAADDFSADITRVRAYADTGVNELRRELRSEITYAADRQDSSVKAQVNDAREELQQQLGPIRTELNDRFAETQKDYEDLVQRFVLVQRAAEDNRVSLLENVREQTLEIKRQHAEDAARAEEQCQGIVRQVEHGVRNELAKVVAMARDLTGDVERTCRRLVDETQQAQESSVSDALRAHKDAYTAAIAEALAEPRQELKTLRALMAEQSAESVGRAEGIITDVHKQSRARCEELKRDIDDLAAKLEEQLTTFAASTRTSLQEQRQELRQHLVRQLEERLRPLSDRISEATGECKVMRRAEDDLGHRCERLQKTCSELAASQEALSQQSSATAQELLEVRAELRADLRQENRSADRMALRYDRPIRSERQVFADLPGADAPSFSVRVEPSDDFTRTVRSQSADRWGWSGHMRDFSRHRPKATFDSVIGASPVRKPASTSPPSSPRPLHGSEDRWGFGGREVLKDFGTLRDSHRLSDPYGSPTRGLLTRARAPLGSPPRSPNSLRATRGG